MANLSGFVGYNNRSDWLFSMLQGNHRLAHDTGFFYVIKEVKNAEQSNLHR